MTNSFSNPEKAEITKSDTVSTHQPFNNKWDLTSSHAATANSTGGQASHSILAALRTRRGAETAEWLTNLETQASLRQNISGSQSNMPAVTTSLLSEPGSSDNGEQAMLSTAVRGLDIIFNDFEKYASQFNLTAEGTDFIVSCTPPIKRNHNAIELYADADETGLCYAGHLSTRYWALVIRGSVSRVEVFIIPAELLLGFSVQSTDESGYKPLLVIEAEWREGKLIWHIDKTIITLDVLPLLAKELFGDLIRVATGQMTESELFAHPLQELTLGQNLAVGYTTKPDNNAPTNGLPTANTTNTPPASAPISQSVADAINSAININTSPATSPNPAVQSNTSSISPQTGLAVQSISMAEQLLKVLSQDINQLMTVGTKALQSDDNVTFLKIKDLTAKMETFKTAVSKGLIDMRQTEEPRANK